MGSNHGPPACEAGALPLSYAPRAPYSCGVSGQINRAEGRVASVCGKFRGLRPLGIHLRAWSLSSLKVLRSHGRGLITDPEGARSHANPLPKAFTGHVRENGALSPDTASLAERLAELFDQFAESTAARVAELVNEGDPTAEPRYYNVAEAAEYLRCCRGRIYNLSSQLRLRGRSGEKALADRRSDRPARRGPRPPRRVCLVPEERSNGGCSRGAAPSTSGFLCSVICPRDFGTSPSHLLPVHVHGRCSCGGCPRPAAIRSDSDQVQAPLRHGREREP